MEHLVVIIDQNKTVEPKLYSCNKNDKTKEEAVKSAKKIYEQKYNNKDYEAYYFIH